ncbi:energy-coupling factor transporter transmembrane protein EcfT [Virgisporangium ochraceum]|uniref:Cobalt ABC transporter permease n=1 Tax=Virgisporangium ochraceum TaxID=65505 RepID=A0A8J3ZZX8_9ACTN|nr:energy-coupling factor transporter transmembrane protein EcfT [Virgisporangium ochraceum]GIJ72363.1 cobalt ABC transporter permease [Virgisporangium ochraceum]
MTYLPGSSPVHRCAPGVKLLLLTVLLALTVRYPLAMLAPTVGLYALARVPWRVALSTVRPLWMLLLVTGVFQVLTLGWERAFEVTGGLLVSVALAGLVTLTTRVTDMLDALMRVLGPVRRVGVDPARIALLLALTIRCVPMLAAIVTSVREAQVARGAGRNPLALAVPVVVRTLRAADALGEALTARGLDD